jgi:hypothetical protein
MKPPPAPIMSAPAALEGVVEGVVEGGLVEEEGATVSEAGEDVGTGAKESD